MSKKTNGHWPDPIHRVFLLLRAEKRAGHRGSSNRALRAIARREIKRAREQ